MHDAGQPKRKEKNSRPPKQQERQRTGPAAPSHLDEEKQRRIAARAAKAMEQQINRRRNRRSLFVWGDRKKAVIKRYPDGTQEILVPQTLTLDQEQYQFPPRSRLLKKLASAAAEQRRASSALMPFDGPSQPFPSSTHALPLSPNHPFFTATPPTPQPAPSPPKLDPLAIDEWFSQSRREQTHRQKAVEWMINVEQPLPSTSSSSPSPSSPHLPSVAQSPLAGIQFQSRAGKACARSHGFVTHDRHTVERQSTLPSVPLFTVSLEPPPENSRIHFVPRRCLHKAQPRHRHQPTTQVPQGTRSRAPDMLQLVSSLHKTLQMQQQQAQQRMQQIEQRLLAEQQRHKKVQDSQRRRLDRIEHAVLHEHTTQPPSPLPSSAHHGTAPMCCDLHDRVTHLEWSVTQEGTSRKGLYHVVATAVQQMDVLQKAMDEHHQKSRADRLSLSKKLDQTLSEIQSLKRTKAAPVTPTTPRRRPVASSKKA